MARLCEEIRSTFAKEEDITIEATKDLPYLEAVINEGLRVCNPIPGGLPPVVPEGCDTYSGIYLPGGTRLGVRTFAVNRSRALFANLDRFVPERWLPKGQRPAEYDNDHLSASKPFSIGSHSCMGRPLARVELRLVVTRMLWAFDFADEASERVEFDDFPVIMLIQKLPMKVRVKTKEGSPVRGIACWVSALGNLPQTPDFTFPYHMTRSPLGLIFSNYEYSYSVLLNDIIQRTLIEAAQKINHQLASNPNLAHQALDDEWAYVQEEHDYLLRFVPDVPEMTYGDILTIFPVMTTWTTQYAGVECDFAIWASPGMSAQRKLGIEHLLIAS
ncbi:MAG: hypothetical protein Q9184_004351 [Pyrenodesmia sp. 2 TL-2023]